MINSLVEMDRAASNSVQNFDGSKADILKKRLLKSTKSPSVVCMPTQSTAPPNNQNTSLRTTIPSNMLVTSMQQPQNSMAISHNLMSHTIAPMKIHSNNSGYPLQLHLAGPSGTMPTATVNVPVQLPGTGSNINMPVQISASSNTVPIQLAGPTVSLPLQVPGPTTNVPVQLPAGGTINVPLQLPATNPSIQLSSSAVPLHLSNNSNQTGLHSSIIHVHMSNAQGRQDVNIDPISSMKTSTQSPIADNSGTVHMKLPNLSNNINPVHMPSNQVHLQIPNSTQSSIQVQIPTSTSSHPGQVRSNPRGVPHVVYIHTPSGLKQVPSTEVINNANSSGNPPQIIVRRPVASNVSSGLQFLPSSKGNIAPKATVTSKPAVIAPANSTQPIVIQKSKQSPNVVPVTIPPNASGKQTFTYLGTVKKPPAVKPAENHSVLVSNNQVNSNLNSSANQKLFLTPMNVSKLQNTKFILPVTLPATMSSKGPIINLQIANGQLQNDPQGNITVMRDTTQNNEGPEIPPLQPLAKNVIQTSCIKDITMKASQPQTPKSEKTFTIAIPGSRVESTGEQEYTLSIPETTSMNEDTYTISISDESGVQNVTEKAFTLTIPEKGKSLLNKGTFDRHDMHGNSIPAPAILRRSNSENIEKKTSHINSKRRISLCMENLADKSKTYDVIAHKIVEKQNQLRKFEVENDDHQVPSLFCDEKLDKDLEYKGNSNSADETEQLPEGSTVPLNPSDQNEEIKDRRIQYSVEHLNKEAADNFYSKQDMDSVKRESSSIPLKKEPLRNSFEDDSPGLVWSNGVARLQGSGLQFQTNEFGLIDVVDRSETDENFILSSKYHTPLKQRIERNREKKPTSPEDLYCCDGCGCHGMAAEFVTPNFCSHTCQNDYQKITQKKKDREAAELKKKRNKTKRILMQKQRSDSEVVSDSKEDKEILNIFETNISPSETSMKFLDQYILKNSEETEVNTKYPWMCGKNGFSWIRYLEHCKSKQAPLKLFKDPFPFNKNGFKIGMKLEAIDPMHPALFTVVSVAEIQGYRLRLHFDGYHENYDFWTNSDSIDIFPPGWCEKNGRILKAPQGFSQGSFSWTLYLKQTKAIAAPRHLFPHMGTTVLRPNGFRIGMKLEAEDRKNSLICVATVADVMESRVLIHFDSWDEIYDFWVDPTSPYIHPVGWADENGLSLTPPNSYKDPDNFTWDRYLSETESTSVPSRFFRPRLPHLFKAGMKLEVVDRRVPFLIRVATIVDVKPHKVRISFDGWPDDLSYWLEDDSPDLHPVGWCLKTGHPLEPPLTDDDMAVVGVCGTRGCRGLGSLLGGAQKTHRTPAACPYRRRPTSESPLTPPDRLTKDQPPPERSIPRPREPKKCPAPTRGRPPKILSSTPTTDPPKEKIPAPRGRPPKHKRLEAISRNSQQISDDESNGSSSTHTKRSRQAIVERSVLASDYDPRPGSRTPPDWKLYCPNIMEILNDLPSLDSDPRNWSQSNVQEFVKKVVQCRDIAWSFCKHRIGGEAFLMLSQEEMVDILGLKLGPAIKVYSTVLQLRKRLVT